ncbi:3D domain-containing protein [Oceanobacillus bengalensis]|uniref:LysM peptidoglycan-binding domain-containing protein n=1 Tax=Oceanobacillus bengalensis TaxID=1435466 RepID=A0A494Z508_9BACI|nr:3D domain-containing protein [Oceanobacillus bengalensis]RKQ17094.1 LysM peptidoglycan-binding domain-containing protein [Oceanobacillus bengalensis]
MKKLVALIVGLIIIGISATTVSADKYEVKTGDNLWTIAENNHTTVESLMDINNLDSDLIFPEQILKLNEEKELEYYAVKQGDTLNVISKAQVHDGTVANLNAWDNLSSNRINPGQELVVNGTTEKKISNTNIDSEEKSETLKTLASTKPNEGKENQEVLESVETKENEVAVEAEVPNGRTFSVEATAYTAYCAGCSGITATGINLRENPKAKVIAVDPNIIPLGSKVYVEGYGYAVAGDTGGVINGNKIDIHVPTKDEAFKWGRRTVEITIVDG